MGDPFHFLIIALRYTITAILVMCSIILVMILADIFVLHPEDPRFELAVAIPFFWVCGILVVLYFLVRKKEKQIEKSKNS